MVVIMQNLVQHDNQGKHKYRVFVSDNIYSVCIGEGKPALGHLGGQLIFPKNTEIHTPDIAFHPVLAMGSKYLEFGAEEAEFPFNRGIKITQVIYAVLRQKTEKLLLYVYKFISLHIVNARLSPKERPFLLPDSILRHVHCGW